MELKCSECGQLLRVDDEFAGKSARCPKCQAVNQVPSAAFAADSGGSPWYLKTPEGQTYGPVARGELESWIREGRVSHQCFLRQESEEHWRQANLIFPALSLQKPAPALRQASSPAVHSAPQGAASSFSGLKSPGAHQHGLAPGGVSAAGDVGLTPHRGALVLMLGILGWITCPLFGVAAWIFGYHDLREMREKRMDPSGMNLTQAGLMLGMIYTLLSAVVILVALFVFLLLLAFG